MSGLTGSTAIDRIAGYGRSGVVIDQVWPASTLFHTPPRSAPRYRMFGSVGCAARAVTRPDQALRVAGSLIGCGPIDTHASPGRARLARDFVSARSAETARSSAPAGISRPGNAR